jgi:hypothetical protein
MKLDVAKQEHCQAPEYIGLTGASHNDGKIFEQIRPKLADNELYGDKAYQPP